jgi:hypothetical protein
MEPAEARADLERLIFENTGAWDLPADDETLIFDAWRKLCAEHAPVFLEKSPHHLVQWSNLELIQQAIAVLPDVQFHIVGLVRNPMDTLYSAWNRWRTVPEKNQYQWLVAYSNLLRLKAVLGDMVNIVRYEDIISDPEALSKEFQFAGVENVDIPSNYFHQRSVSKWKSDKLFGFVLSEEVVHLAMQFGYVPESMSNTKRSTWGVYKVWARAHRKITPPARKSWRNLTQAHLRDSSA